MERKIYFSREEMYKLNVERLSERGVSIDDIALIAYNQQKRYVPDTRMVDCVESVKKILSYTDVFHLVQLSIEIDRLTEEKVFRYPIQDILAADLGMFGVDEIVGLNIAGLFGIIGQTNFGDIDVNKPGIVNHLNELGKRDSKVCHTFLDDVVGAIAAAASTRVAQIMSQERAQQNKLEKVS